MWCFVDFCVSFLFINRFGEKIVKTVSEMGFCFEHYYLSSLDFVTLVRIGRELSGVYLYLTCFFGNFSSSFCSYSRLYVNSPRRY